MIYKFDKTNLSYKKITTKVIGISLIAILTITLGISLVTLRNINDVKMMTNETKSIVLRDNDVFTKDKLKNYINELNIAYPDIVMAQAEQESSNFTSKVFKENNNLFGMTESKGRPSSADGVVNGYAYYKTWRESVQDYAFFQASYVRNAKTENQYLLYLKQNYAQDTDYVKKLKRLIKEE